MLLDPQVVKAVEDAGAAVVVPRAPVLSARAAARVPLGGVALERRASFLGADGQRPTPLEFEALLGQNDLLEISFVDRVQLASASVCRITIHGARGTEYATGFLVGPGLIMTNHHVLPDEPTAARATAEFDYRYEVSGELRASTRFALDATRLFVADEALDYALCALAPRSVDGGAEAAARSHLRLIERSGKVSDVDFVTLIQHPDGRPMQIALRENEVLPTPAGGDAIWYRADTAHGSSGSPVFNDSVQVAALHRSGRIQRDAQGRYLLRDGGAVASLEGLTEYDVLWEANVGTRISHICQHLRDAQRALGGAKAAAIESLFGRDDVMSSAVRDTAEGPRAEEETMVREVKAAEPVLTNAGALSVLVPMNLRVSLELAPGAAQAMARAAPPNDAPLAMEAARMQIPAIYDGLEDRAGFDPGFLDLPGGKTLEMPALTPAGLKIAAPLRDGSGVVLRYHKFSVVVHKERRLPLVTASNVDWRDASRPRDPATGKRYSREQLTEIPKGIAEQWVLDERLAPAHQLPDIFYTEDRQAFDKGHIVRRDDVCWGASFEDMQMANGDTYHVTNCTPQIKGFNQSQAGVANWGDFENEVQRVTAAQKVMIFAGPVLKAKDRWFRGRDDHGAVRVQVPSAFWKIVVAKEQGKARAWGFVLEQDVSGITEKELKFDAVWKPRRRAIATLQGLMRGWLDLSALAAIDQPL